MSSTILFAMLNESGHLNPTYKLAKGLRERGHDVRYLAIEDVRPAIEEQGFAVEPLFPDLLPKGTLAAEERLGRIAQRRAITKRFRALLDRLASGAPFEVDRVAPALVLVDVTQTQIALWARRARVPFVYINTSLPQTRDPGVPPLRTSLPYGERGIARAAAELAWEQFLAQRLLSAQAVAPLGMMPPYALVARASGRFGVAMRELDRQTAYMPQLPLVPEIVLCAREFDFPRASRSTRFYSESVDLERREPSFDFAQLDPNKPLVYASLGGQLYRARDTPAFFRRLIAVMRARPHLQLLLALGRHTSVEALGPLPANVACVRVAPQLAVLERAQVMVTHGGLGSVKECLLHGVPMLLCPLAVDQPGNAARVLHYGAGLRADVGESSVGEIGRSLDRLLMDPKIRRRTSELSARFRELESSRPGPTIVESFL